MKGYLHFADRLLGKRGKDPVYVVLFVTERCTANCLHCLLGPEDRPGREGELTLEEYEAISRGMGEILFLLPTGGEPFLRQDLPRIVEIFRRNNRVRNTGIPTNGSMPGRVVEGVEQILDLCPGMDLGIDVSFDGVGPEHDRLRGTPGLFEKAVETYRRLEELRERRPDFNLNVAVTVSALNQHRLDELYRFLSEELHVRCINPLLVRGTPRDPAAAGVDPERYEAFVGLLGEEIRQGRLEGYSRFGFSGLINAMKNVRQQVIGKIIKDNEQQVPCYAASLSCVIGSRGEVYPCELLDRKLGSLREEGLDFQRIWRSGQAAAVRDHINNTGCFCTYECFLTNSIIFNPRMIPRLLREWISIGPQRASSCSETNESL
jgi:MoaA/NifB/PqqE/SkfB family radical SAM enzyme